MHAGCGGLVGGDATEAMLSCMEAVLTCCGEGPQLATLQKLKELEVSTAITYICLRACYEMAD